MTEMEFEPEGDLVLGNRAESVKKGWVERSWQVWKYGLDLYTGEEFVTVE